MTDTRSGHRENGQLPRGEAQPAQPRVAGLPGTDETADGATAGSAARDPAAIRAFIESFTSLLTQAGFPRTPARIFVALLTSDSSQLTAADLAQMLQTSPASVSGGVRYLIQVGLVTAEGEPGSRRQHYRMPTDVWDEIVRLRNRQFTRWAAEMRGGVSALGAGTPAGARMADTVRYFEFLNTEVSGLLARWQERAESAGGRQDR